MAPHDPLDVVETAHQKGDRDFDQITATSTDLDENYEFFKVRDEVDATPEEIKKVVRKIDYHVVPILFVIYFLQYLDKNAINYGNSYGLKEGTNLHGQDFSWLGRCQFWRAWLTSGLTRSRLDILLWLPGRAVPFWLLDAETPSWPCCVRDGPHLGNYRLDRESTCSSLTFGALSHSRYT